MVLQMSSGGADVLTVVRHTRRHPAEPHRLLRRCGARAVLAVSVSLFGLTVAQTAALAGSTPDLSSTVLSDSLPGFVASPAGTATNGPINQSNVNYFGPAASDLTQFIANGSISGFLRTWAHEPLNGDVVVIAALWFNDPNQIGAVMAGVSNGSEQSGATPFAVPGIDGGLGFSFDKAGNQSFEVTFAKGDILFTVGVVSGFHDLTSADAVSLALKQADKAPGVVQLSSSAPATSSDPTLRFSYDLGEALPFLIIGIVIVYFIQRRRKKGKTTLAPSPGPESFGLAGFISQPIRTNEQLQGAASVSFSRDVPAAAHALREPIGIPIPGSLPTRDPGWKTDPVDATHLAYWDGTQYTAHKKWDGAQWADC
jgi:hypothetical protein